MKYFILCLLALLGLHHSYSQKVLKGEVFYKDEEHLHIHALPGANVYWLNTQTGVTTDASGQFEISKKKENNQLIISYIGYKTDTIAINPDQYYLKHEIREVLELGEVEVVAEKKDMHISQFGVNLTEHLNEGELLKAACCNLSESFETNPSVDISFSDPVTGTKQIQMLGLTGPYIQITQENIPAIRGANQTAGMSFIPGSWVESIQISKGAGSVINGFESIAGQINTELKKPTREPELFINLFGNDKKRLEINTDANVQLNEHFSTALFLHHNQRKHKADENGDGFLDMPVGSQWNLMNRWHYSESKTGLESDLIFKALQDTKQSGQIAFEPNIHQNSTSFWGSENITKRFEAFYKIGKVFPEIPYKSFGFQSNFVYHNQEAYYGFTSHNIKQKSLYLNGIYQSILSNTYHKFKTGLSLVYDNYDENVHIDHYDRTEKSFGGFFEYDFDGGEKFSLNAGLRTDYHNYMGWFLTPRLHVRYEVLPKITLRTSVGRGKRMAQIFTENTALFASNRTLEIQKTTNYAYGLEPETAWNYGFNVLWNFRLVNRNSQFSLDYYETYFKNQIVVDRETPGLVSIYNLNGKSFAKSLQVSLNLAPFEGFETRWAYKFYDVKTTYNHSLKDKILLPHDRWFINLAYETPSKNWHFDMTANRVGSQRIPAIFDEKNEFYTSAYWLLQGQIRKVFDENFEIYTGVENLTNFVQENPIKGAADPFGNNFDAGLIYAPTEGRKFYAGLRFRLPFQSQMKMKH